MSQDIDWPGLRAAAVRIGIKPAARLAGRDLPPDELARFVERVAKRAVREGWEVKRLAVESTVSTIPASSVHVGGAVPKKLSTAVLSGAETLSEENAENSRAGRAALLRYGAKVASHAADLDPGAGLASAPLVASVAKTLALAGDWQQQDSAPRLTLNLFQIGGGMGVERKVIDVERA